MSPLLFLPKSLELKSEERSNILLKLRPAGRTWFLLSFLFESIDTSLLERWIITPHVEKLAQDSLRIAPVLYFEKNTLPAYVWSQICTKFKAPEVMSLQYLKSKLRKRWIMSWEMLIGLWHVSLSGRLHLSLGAQFQKIHGDELCSYLLPTYKHIYIYVFSGRGALICHTPSPKEITQPAMCGLSSARVIPSLKTI